MASVKYFIKGNQNPTTIYVRLRDGRENDFSVSTGLTINPEFWNNNKKWIINSSKFQDKLNFEKRLRGLESIIFSERNNRISSGLPINKDWFKNVVNKWRGKSYSSNSDNLIDLMTKYKENLQNRIRNNKKGVSKGTIKNYNTTIQRLIKFETYKKKTYRIQEIDLSFHSQYLDFAYKKLSLSTNSIGKDIRQIKTICFDARDIGLNVNTQALTRKFVAPSEKAIFTTLTEEEIDLVFQFKGVNHLENARDWLIIGCWTGCRGSDLMKLTKENIKIHSNETKVIQYKQNKTGKLINVPMNKMVKEIIERNKGFPRPISLEKFNKYIKIVSKESGLCEKVIGSKQNRNSKKKEIGTFEKWELIRSHTCRRTFATIHYNKLPNKTIMAVTGHSTEKMLLDYIGETETDHLDDYVNLWTKTNK